MFPYKTNSADYLDYIAATMSREEILADPKFCGLLENPYIKDNMEVALAWHDAKFGDYQDKYNFVEYYLCNGPELDADTLLHYRGLAQADPVVMEIAYSYFTDPVVLSQIREEKYGKKKEGDWTDCFRNPCFYLGDFSGVMGSLGDTKNIETYFSLFAQNWTKSYDAAEKYKKQEEDYKKTGKSTNFLKHLWQGITDSKLGETLKGSAVGNALGIGDDFITIEPPEGTPQGASAGSQNLQGCIRPAYLEGWYKIGKSIFNNDTEFASQLQKNLKWAVTPKWGDALSAAVSHSVDLLDKANTTRMLGDCYRMWSQVRRLRIFASDNQYGPIKSDQLVQNLMPDGTMKTTFAKERPTPSDATIGIKAPAFNQ